MGKLARRFLGRLGVLADRLVAGWLLLLCGRVEAPEVEGVERRQVMHQIMVICEQMKREHLLLLPTVTLTGIGMGTVGYSNFTSVSAG